MKIREALIGMVETALKAKQANDAAEALGYPDNPYWDIYAGIFDAIYTLIGEDTETIDQSLTYKVLHDPELTDEERADILLGK